MLLLKRLVFFCCFVSAAYGQETGFHLCDNDSRAIRFEITGLRAHFDCYLPELCPACRDNDTLIANIVRTLKSYDPDRIAVVVHADIRGSREQNLIATQRQANVIAADFIANGFAESAVSAIGKGEEEPVVPETEILRLKNDPKTVELLYRQNSRIEVIVYPKEVR